MTRRDFVMATAALPLAAQPAKVKPVLCIFSKHMSEFQWDELGAKAKEVGFDGVDLTVRPKGHVLPERVAEDLPKAVDAIRKHGLSVPMITTDLKDASDPAAKPTFEAMKKAGISLYKVGYWTAKKGQGVMAAAQENKRKLDGLLTLSKQYGLTAGLHNHSGPYFGCAVWDYRELIKDVSPRDAGYYFDPGHATVEGGLNGWRVSLDLVLPRLKMSAIKDFYWEKSNGQWKNHWCPLGEGMVNWQAVFAEYAKAEFGGPLSLHLEYPGGDDLPSIRKDLEYMKKQVSAAYA
ncbi:sugar phosphate isomerase/epimerase family protein [Paludibaculum fermentans]|uniref:Sugar phosphate isomerase/epimerase n=1 Tax=Paludibaculum fermentans TaxID=1473598 RepID=A0A7S7SIL3_PALFE|nr:sugar phosphate isomerase/epimerase family protein [Paludibaculum fermentans]QOY86214.1 sugar phosphate isomerase/epimerase [Paludibaculum fermentans]